MKTILELNEAVKELFASNQLPESYLTVSDKQIYICSPCGDPIVRLQHLGTSRMANKDIPLTYNITKNFVDTNLQELKDFFKAKALTKTPFANNGDSDFKLSVQKTTINGVQVHRLSISSNTCVYINNYYSDNTLILRNSYVTTIQAEDVLKTINEELKFLKKAIKPHLSAFNEYAEAFNIVNKFKQKYLTCS